MTMRHERPMGVSWDALGTLMRVPLGSHETAVYKTTEV